MAVSAAILAHAPAAFLSLKSPLNRNRPRDKNRTKNAEKPPFQAVFLRKMVRVVGLEPTSLAALEPKSSMFTNFIIPADHRDPTPKVAAAHPQQALRKKLSSGSAVNYNQYITFPPLEQ